MDVSAVCIIQLIFSTLAILFLNRRYIVVMCEAFVLIRISNSISVPFLDREYRFLHLVFPPLSGMAAQIVVQAKKYDKIPLMHCTPILL